MNVKYTHMTKHFARLRQIRVLYNKDLKWIVCQQQQYIILIEQKTKAGANLNTQLDEDLHAKYKEVTAQQS